jgi:hypothetical protein
MQKQNQNLIVGDSLGLSILAIVVMIVVWLTLNIPEARQKQTNKFCYYHCLEETDKKMTGKVEDGPRYMSNLKECYQECTAQENKEKDEKNIDKDASS